MDSVPYYSAEQKLLMHSLSLLRQPSFVHIFSLMDHFTFYDDHRKSAWISELMAETDQFLVSVAEAIRRDPMIENINEAILKADPRLIYTAEKRAIDLEVIFADENVEDGVEYIPVRFDSHGILTIFLVDIWHYFRLCGKLPSQPKHP